MTQQLYIFDTTLRDGEQSPGASMNQEEKVQIAKLLDKMRVDIIEAGFPAASTGDFEAVSCVAKQVQYSTVCALSRAIERDIELAGQALTGAPKRRIHTFIATSPIHMKKKLRMPPNQVVERTVKAIEFAKQRADEVEFSAEDAGRSEVEFLCQIFSKAIEAGATILNIPDTVGYTLPHEFGQLVQQVIAGTAHADKVIWSVHCHNDLGLAAANSLAAVASGARQIECTINGLGERAGNCALEEVVMAIKTRSEHFKCDPPQLDTRMIVPTSKLVSAITGFPVQPNKAVVGANAFAHASGIHQDGVLKHRMTYEIMEASDVGWSTNVLVLSKHSGRHAFASRLRMLGIDLSSETELDTAFKHFKTLADQKREIYDEDLLALVAESNRAQPSEDRYQLEALSCTMGSHQASIAHLSLYDHGTLKKSQAEGCGPIDATFKAIENTVQSGALLLLYHVNNISLATDSQGEVCVRLQQGPHTVNGTGAATDIVLASAKAYLAALNRLEHTASPEVLEERPV